MEDCKYNNISQDRLETYEVGRCDRRGEPEPSKITSQLVIVAVPHLRVFINIFYLINVYLHYPMKTLCTKLTHSCFAFSRAIYYLFNAFIFSSL